jgi:peptidoglycan/LPS O-acetylase OafA/YrhL
MSTDSAAAATRPGAALGHLATQSPNMAQERVAAIDILRGFAALAVVLYHARADFTLGFRETWTAHGLSGGPDVWLSYAFAFFSLGGLGVPVFFLMSGYCIHLSVAMRRTIGTPFEWNTMSFYWRRFVRIYPVYFAALCLTAVVDHLIGGGTKTASVFLLNLLMLQETVGPVFGSNTVFWTLSIEFHLYLFYPVVLWWIFRFGPGVALMFAGVITFGTCSAYHLLDLGQVLVYAHGGSPLFLSHLFIWVAGVYLAEVDAGRVRLPHGILWTVGWLGAFVIGTALQISARFDWSPLFLAIGTLGLVDFALRAIPAIGLHRGQLGAALVGLGLISYSLYATHRITFEMIDALALSGRSGSVLPALLWSALAVSFAVVFFWAIERHSLRRRPARPAQQPS